MPTVKFKTTAEYLSSLIGKTKSATKELRSIIKKAAPKAEEVISYNIPAFKSEGRIIIWYAGWKEHVSLYPLSTAMMKAIKGLADYKSSKGTVKIPLGEKLPAAMITKIVKFRLKELKEMQEK